MWKPLPAPGKQKRRCLSTLQAQADCSTDWPAEVCTVPRSPGHAGASHCTCPGGQKTSPTSKREPSTELVAWGLSGRLSCPLVTENRALASVEGRGRGPALQGQAESERRCTEPEGWAASSGPSRRVLAEDPPQQAAILTLRKLLARSRWLWDAECQDGPCCLVQRDVRRQACAHTVLLQSRYPCPLQVSTTTPLTSSVVSWEGPHQ